MAYVLQVKAALSFIGPISGKEGCAVAWLCDKTTFGMANKTGYIFRSQLLKIRGLHLFCCHVLVEAGRIYRMYGHTWRKVSICSVATF